MNKVVLMGRLTRDPEVRYSQGENSLAIARYTLAVDRRFGRNNGDGQTADFIPCVVFGKSAEFAEQYFKQGMRVTICGRIQTGSYTNREGQKVYTTEGLNPGRTWIGWASQNNGGNYSNNNYSNNQNQYNGDNRRAEAPKPAAAEGIDGFMNIPDGIDEDLPFN